MKRIIQTLLILTFPILLFSCGKDKDIIVPPLTKDFADLESDHTGAIKYINLDNGKRYPIRGNRANYRTSPDTIIRAVCNYELVWDENRKRYVNLDYARPILVVEPKDEKHESFSDGMKEDPVYILSIWQGKKYLNMQIGIKTSQGGKHSFQFKEEKISVRDNIKYVDMILYHNANGTEEKYKREVYLSVKTAKYFEDGVDEVVLRFSYHTKNRNGEVFQQNKYKEAGYSFPKQKKKYM